LSLHGSLDKEALDLSHRCLFFLHLYDEPLMVYLHLSIWFFCNPRTYDLAL